MSSSREILEAHYSLLTQAIKNTGVPSGDSSSLSVKIEQANSLHEEDYTAESWQQASAAIAGALDNAKEAALLDVDNTQNDSIVHDALMDLTTALAELRQVPKDRTELYRDFVNQRFGMFMHYSMSTYTHNGTVEEFDYSTDDWGPAFADEKYFNPTDLDPEQWADAAVSAGMEWACLTTKHHDGFDIWPSKVSTHDVENSSVPDLDVVQEYLDAFRSRGISAGLYFSILDLNLGVRNPGDLSGKPDYEEAKQYILDQIEELMTNYGDIPFLILDGWNTDWGGPTYDELPYEEVASLVHRLQPNCIILNISCETNDTHTDLNIFENGAGQTIPSWYDLPAAACHNLQGEWFWKAHYPTDQLRSVDWVLDLLYSQNKKNASFILNAAPNPEGKLDANTVKRLMEIGEAYEKLPDVEEIPSSWYKDYDTSLNLAYKKPISQSSLYGRWYGDRAADGILDGDIGHDRVFSTTDEYYPWWQVDLGESKEIGDIAIWNREDEAKQNLNDFWIFASDSPFADDDTPQTLSNKEGVTAIHLTQVPDPSIKAVLNTSARYVRIQLDNPDSKKSLVLSEVILSSQDMPETREMQKAPGALQRYQTTGASKNQLNLPQSMEVKLSDATAISLDVEWDNGTPIYDSMQKGTYVFTGSFQHLPEDVRNSKNIQARAVVTIGDHFVVPATGYSPSQWDDSRSGVRTSDGSGLSQSGDVNATHGNAFDANGMWHSGENPGANAWIQYTFEQPVSLEQMYIWNHNQYESNKPDPTVTLKRGLRKVTITYSEDGQHWQTLGGDGATFEFAKGTGESAMKATNLTNGQPVNFNGVRTQYVRITADPDPAVGTWGGDGFYGLSEVMFTGKSVEQSIDRIQNQDGTLPSSGGEVSLVVMGQGLYDSVLLQAFQNDQPVAGIRGFTSGTSGQQTASLSFPANSSEEVQEYCVKASLDGGLTWSEAYCLVNVAPKSSISVATDKSDYLINEDITLTVSTPPEVSRVALINENGRYLGLSSVHSVIQDGQKIWTIHTSVATAGQRTLSVLVQQDGHWSNPVPFQIRVNFPQADPAMVYEAIVDQSSASVNQSFAVRIVTNQSATKLSIRNELGRSMGYDVISVEDHGDSRIYTIHMSVGTAGLRVLSFYVAGIDGVFSNVSVESSILITP
nr:alpha-L-fucosidase [uncultured Solibaculum sp.]